MNEFVIRKAWKKEIITLVLLDLGLIYCIVFVPYHRYAFTWKPLLIASLWVFYTTYKHRKEQIRFDEYGITLEDGTLCKWQNIKLLEYKHLGQWDWSLIVHTKNNMYKNNMSGYNFDSRKLLKYMQINHPDITFNIYAKFFLGGRFESKHIYVPKEFVVINENNAKKK